MSSPSSGSCGGCSASVAGAASEEQLLAKMKAAGFEQDDDSSPWQRCTAIKAEDKATTASLLLQFDGRQATDPAVVACVDNINACAGLSATLIKTEIKTEKDEDAGEETAAPAEDSSSLNQSTPSKQQPAKHNSSVVVSNFPGKLPADSDTLKQFLKDQCSDPESYMLVKGEDSEASCSQELILTYSEESIAKEITEKLNGFTLEDIKLEANLQPSLDAQSPIAAPAPASAAAPAASSTRSPSAGPAASGSNGLASGASTTTSKPPRRTGGGPPSVSQRAIDFPLRILVDSEMVGAIIGRGGQTIKEITQETRARVDVHRKESLGSSEKAITIYGQPENCTNACNKIMKVMQEEAKQTGKPTDIELKLLAHNNLIGRIIGRGGATIKKVMEETGTRIAVSSINDLNSFNMERIITISGDVDAISRAESEVSTKLRLAYESDIHAIMPQSVMFPGLHPAAMISTAGLGPNTSHGGPGGPGPQPHQHGHGPMHAPAPMASGPSAASSGGYSHNQGPQAAPPPPGRVSQSINGHGQRPPHPHHGGAVMHGGGMGANYPVNFNGGGAPPGSAMEQRSASLDMSHVVNNSNASEITYLYVPNTSVGAIIGTKGTHIRKIIKFSGASVKIEQQQVQSPPPSEKALQSGMQATFPSPDERKVTVVGNPEAQWKAQYLIYEKLQEEAYNKGSTEDQQLLVEIMVPSKHVGRIIGRGGQNVRDLQRMTGATIKLPSQSQAREDAHVTESPVHIIGPFYSVQSAQRRLRAMITSVSPNFDTSTLNGKPSKQSGMPAAALGGGGGGAAAAAEGASIAATNTTTTSEK